MSDLAVWRHLVVIYRPQRAGCVTQANTDGCVSACAEAPARLWQLTQWKQIAAVALQLSITWKEVWGLRVSAVAARRHEAPGPAITVS